MRTRDAPRFQVLALALAQPDLRQCAGWSSPPGDARDHRPRRGAPTRSTSRRATATSSACSSAPRRGASAATEVTLPVEGSFALSVTGRHGAADPRCPVVVLDLQAGRARARSTRSTPTAACSNTGLQPLGPFDAPDDIVATEVKVKSHDGAMVPLSIIHQQRLKLDGTNPTLLYGYGSYGITEEPVFSPTRLAWLEHGRRVRASPTCAAAASTARTGTRPATRPPSPTPGRTSSPAPST